MIKDIFCKYFNLFLPLLCVLALSGCSDDDIPDPVGSTEGGITAVVNGANWSSSQGNYKLGNRTITDGASAFVSTGDTLTIVGVQVQGTDTTAIMLSVKLKADKVGSYQLRTGTAGDGKAYFFPDGISANDLRETREQYSTGITNGELQISKYDLGEYRVSGNFGFSMSATGETTYTVIAGEIENVTF